MLDLSKLIIKPEYRGDDKAVFTLALNLRSESLVIQPYTALRPQEIEHIARDLRHTLWNHVYGDLKQHALDLARYAPPAAHNVESCIRISKLTRDLVDLLHPKF